MCACACVCVLACMQIHTFVFSCRADRQQMGVPYSLEDSSSWPVCCLPAAHTPAIHLLLPGPPPLPSLDTHTHTHTQRLTMVSVCIVMLYGHKSSGVEGPGGRSTRVDQRGSVLRFSGRKKTVACLCMLF